MEMFTSKEKKAEVQTQRQVETPIQIQEAILIQVETTELAGGNTSDDGNENWWK